MTLMIFNYILTETYKWNVQHHAEELQNEQLFNYWID